MDMVDTVCGLAQQPPQAFATHSVPRQASDINVTVSLICFVIAFPILCAFELTKRNLKIRL